MRDELAKGLETLLELRGSFDYILIETTGVRREKKRVEPSPKTVESSPKTVEPSPRCVWSRGTADKLAPGFDRATQVWPILGQWLSPYG